MVVGIGVNVHHAESDFPPELRARATSVRLAAGTTCERAAILARLLEGFEHRYARALRDGPATLLKEWQSLSALQPGDTVRVLGPTGPAQGGFSGIDEEGGLRLTDSGGRILRVPFGEIVETLEP